MFLSQGKIIYFNTWAIVQCSKELLQYYWTLTMKQTGIKLNKPRFGSHISLIRGEAIDSEKRNLWKKYHEKTIDFHYSHDIETNGDYFWLPVVSESLSDLRTEMGLTSVPPFGFHLTLGKTYTVKN